MLAHFGTVAHTLGMTIEISYASDILCIWAYVAEARLDELRREYGDAASIEYRFIPVFGATAHRIGSGWKDYNP
jgi:predicted DsbA family dithiol-disulfide isomerase